MKNIPKKKKKKENEGNEKREKCGRKKNDSLKNLTIPKSLKSKGVFSRKVTKKETHVQSQPLRFRLKHPTKRAHSPSIVFIIDFIYISQLVSQFLLLPLTMYLFGTTMRTIQ